MSSQSSAVAGWRPRVVHSAPPLDVPGAVDAATALLTCLGIDLADPHVAETPRRMVEALVEMTAAPELEATSFPNDEGYDELVVVEEIPVNSLCEHHMLPFVGVARVGYLPDSRILGLSKFARLVDHHARRPQTQERLTQQVARHLDELLQPRGVGVTIEAEHTCMSIRGARAAGTRTATSALLGNLRDDPRSRAEFLALAPRSPGRSSWMS